MTKRVLADEHLMLIPLSPITEYFEQGLSIDQLCCRKRVDNPLQV